MGIGQIEEHHYPISRPCSQVPSRVKICTERTKEQEMRINTNNQDLTNRKYFLIESSI